MGKIWGVAFSRSAGRAIPFVAPQLGKKAAKQAAILTAVKAEEKQRQQKEHADFERKILGQRSQRIENASQSRTDFTSDLEEDMDPRSLKQDRLLAKKRRLIGFE